MHHYIARDGNGAVNNSIIRYVWENYSGDLLVQGWTVGSVTTNYRVYVFSNVTESWQINNIGVESSMGSNVGSQYILATPVNCGTGSAPVDANWTGSQTNIIDTATTSASDNRIGGNETLSGTLKVTGASTLTGNATLAGTLAVTGASTLTGNATLSGSLNVVGDFTGNGQLNMNSTGTSRNHSILVPNMTVGGQNEFIMGIDSSNGNNSVEIGFMYAGGSGSASNYGRISILGSPTNGLYVYNSGIVANAATASTSTSTGALKVVGGLGANHIYADTIRANGGVSQNLTYGYLNSSGVVGTATGTNTYSIIATNRITCTEIDITSDIRAKENIELFSDDLCYNLTNNLSVKHFNMIGESKPKLGFIAQELETVIPNCISTMEKGDIKDFKVVDYSQITAINTGAINYLAKQFNDKINELQEKINSLEAKLNN